VQLNLQYSQEIVCRAVKLKKISGGRVSHMNYTNLYKFFYLKSLGKLSLGKPRRKWEDKTEIELSFKGIRTEVF
jgi:hypothetical protein